MNLLYWRIPIISASEMITAASQHSLCPGANHQWSWWHHRSQARGETLGYQWIILKQKIKIGRSGCCGFGECGYGWYDEWSSLKFLTRLDVRKTCMGWASPYGASKATARVPTWWPFRICWLHAMLSNFCGFKTGAKGEKLMRLLSRWPCQRNLPAIFFCSQK